MKVKRLIVAEFVLCALLVPATSFALNDAHAIRRWAVAASDEVRECGLADLLTVRLSEQRDLELVERDQLDLATREVELAALLGAEATRKRLNLGRLLRADALILLSMVEHKEKKSVKLLVGDCRYGARLREEYIRFDPARVDAVARRCAEIVGETQQHYAAGIRQLFCVTQLLSKNLTHDFDHLQSAYASLLASSLGARPGAAVVEVEEARAIGRELSLRKESLKQRVVPVFIEGEFEVSSGDGEPRVNLSMRVKDARRKLNEVQKSNLSQDDVARLLTREIPEELLRLSGAGGTPLLPARQFEMLVSRADAFSGVGIYEHASALREAALLIRPNDFEQRLALVGDYLRWNGSRERADVTAILGANRNFLPPKEKSKMLSQMHALRRKILRRALPHVELLMRRKLLNPYEATKLAFPFCRAMAHLPETDEFAGRPRVNQEARRFFWNIYSSIGQLDYGLRNGAMHPAVHVALGPSHSDSGTNRLPQDQIRHWTSDALFFITAHAPSGGKPGAPPTEEDYRYVLKDLERFLTTAAPKDVPLIQMANVTTARLNQLIGLGCLSTTEVRAFFYRLRKSGAEMNAFYGRMGLLALQVRADRRLPVNTDTLREADELLRIVDGFDGAAEHFFRHHLAPLRQEVASRLGKTASKQHRLPQNAIPEPDPSPRVTFHPLPKSEAPWHELVRCNDSLDLMWSHQAVYVMRERGAARKVFEIDRGSLPSRWTNQIYDAVWDGEDIWVGTMTGGVYLVSLDGELLGQVQGQQGLPPYRQRVTGVELIGSAKMAARYPLRLHAVEPGKCIAIGEYGSDRRQWLALLKKEDSGSSQACRAKVFHEATKAVRDRLNIDDSDPQLAFAVSWLIEYTMIQHPEREPSRRRHEKPRLLLVGRNSNLYNGEYRPLAIDLATLRVFVFPARLPSPAQFGLRPRAAIGSDLVFAGPYQLARHFPMNGNGAGWDRKPLIERHASARQPYLLRLARQLYNPGTDWYRIHLDNWHVEKLNDKPLPNEYRFEHYGVSAHHGLVAWNAGDRLYQVRIDAELADSCEQFGYVPSQERERHRQAAHAIRRLGGHVDARWKRRPDGRHWDKPAWRTIVFLSNDWQGGDDGLRHLADLYNLADLQLVRADVGNEGMRHIVRLSELESLALVETNVTDVGLAELSHLPGLIHCHLECAAGGRELSDKGLKHLGDLPSLRMLTLYGPGFTDAGLASFHRRRAPFSLFLYDTGITREGIAELREKVRGSRVYEGGTTQLLR